MYAQCGLWAHWMPIWLKKAYTCLDATINLQTSWNKNACKNTNNPGFIADFEHAIQRHIQKPVKYLRWRFLQK